ncbi:MAG: hypothetical protein ABMA13_09235 [Chthoniobacteraceae bacterium]
MMVRLLAALLLVWSSLVLGGCASSESDDPNRVSTIPWNRPERWESQGPLGGMMNAEGR